MDVLEIDGASNRGIDEIRELRENVKFGASGGKYKIYIIDEVHMLTTEAFNALLKTLEEPPEHVKFFFATTELNDVPATIVSRCQRFELRRITHAMITEQLSGIAKNEKIKIPAETLSTIARYANGSMRDALSTLDKLIAYSGTEIVHTEALDILGVVDKDLLFDISNAVLKSDIDKALAITSNLFDKGKDIEQFLLDLINHFRNILLSKYSADTQKLIELSKDDVDKIIESGKQFTQSQLVEIINMLAQLQNELRWALSKRTTFEVGMVKLIRVRSKIGLDQLVERLEAMENNLNSSGYTARESFTAVEEPVIKEEVISAAKPTTPVQPDDLFAKINASWQNVLLEIGRVSPLLKTYLAEGSPVELKGETLSIGFAPANTLHQETLSKQNYKETLEKKFKDIFGTSIKLNFKLVEVAAKPKAQQPQKTIDSPLVEKVRAKFGAKIIGVKA